MSSPKNTPLPQSLGLPFTGADSHAHLDDERLLPDLSGMLERAALRRVAHCSHVSSARALRGEPQCDSLTPRPRCRKPRTSALSAACIPKTCSPPTRRNGTPCRCGEKRSAGAGYRGNRAGLSLRGRLFSSSALSGAVVPQTAPAGEGTGGKPVVIHARDAWDKMFAILDDEDMPGRPLLWHCFGGDAARAKQITDRGWHIAFGGASTFKANGEVREALHAVLPERIMLETDCPYLAPVPWRGKTNEPALCVFTAECLAGELGMGTAELWTLRATTPAASSACSGRRVRFVCLVGGERRCFRPARGWAKHRRLFGSVRILTSARRPAAGRKDAFCGGGGNAGGRKCRAGDLCLESMRTAESEGAPSEKRTFLPERFFRRQGWASPDFTALRSAVR